MQNWAKRMKKTLLRDWQYWIFLLLPIAYLLIFEYYPMLGVQIAFRNFKSKYGIWGSEWAGLKWLKKFIESYQFERVVTNTLVLSLYNLTVTTILPIFFALVFNCVEHPRYKKFVQTIVTLPHFISVVGFTYFASTVSRMRFLRIRYLFSPISERVFASAGEKAPAL